MEDSFHSSGCGEGNSPDGVENITKLENGPATELQDDLNT